MSDTPAPVRCPCGTALKPALVASNSADYVRLRCPTCGRRGFSERLSNVVDGWNRAMKYQRLIAANNRLDYER